MKKILLGIFVIAEIVFTILFFSSLGQGLRKRAWGILDQDEIYLENGSLIRGVIWSEMPDLITGALADDQSLFLIESKDCKRIEKDVFLNFFKQLL